MSLLRAATFAASVAGVCGCAGPAVSPVPPSLPVGEMASPVAACGSAPVREAILRQVNAVRLAGRSCGGQHMGSAAPLSWNAPLQSVAARHSADMARRNYFDHASPDGQRVAQRLEAEGYRWRAVGENIAGGNSSVNDAIQGWLASAPHCRNLMDPVYRDVAVACVQREGSTWGTYWTMIFATRH